MAINNKERLAIVLIFVIALMAIIFLLRHAPIPQDPSYHRFADTRSMFSIPNFWDVMSNLPFLFVGGLGLYKLLVSKTLCIAEEIKTAYVIFFTGVALVSLSSVYYHLWPDNQTLVWDRLPMTMSFMALFVIVVSEFISVSLGRVILWPAIVLGLLSVAYWHATEMNGQGDLRLYAFVQFFPMLAMPIIFVCFQSRFDGVVAYGWLLLAYLIAKVMEHFDTVIFNSLGVISGHSLKHIAVAVGIYVLVIAYQKRLYRQ